MNFFLTDSNVLDIPPPRIGNVLMYDSQVRGFAVRVTAAGSRSWVFNYRTFSGKERRLTIGRVEDWPIRLARTRARVLRREIDLGNDPLAERHAMRKRAVW